MLVGIAKNKRTLRNNSSDKDSKEKEGKSIAESGNIKHCTAHITDKETATLSRLICDVVLFIIFKITKKNSY